MGISLYDAQQIGSNAGLRTQYGVILPPGARVAAYVRSTGLQSGDDSFLATNLVPTLAQGLARCRANMGDFVVCLPGHVENVTDATTFSNALLAGSRIIGVGRGSVMPRFVWTATAGKWTIGVNDVQIAGLKIDTTGISGVVQAINVTGEDVSLSFNEYKVSSFAVAPANLITLAATANRAIISGSVFRGFMNAIPNTVITVAGTVADVNISDNEFDCPAVAATGHINVSGAATGLKIFRNYMYNTVANSTVCISFAAAVSDGHVADNRFAILANGVASATGITFGAGSLVKANQNYCTDEPQRSGVLSPPAVAT